MSGLNYENPRDTRDRNTRESQVLNLRHLDGPIGTSGSCGQLGASAKTLNYNAALSREKEQRMAKAARETEMRDPYPHEDHMAMRSVMGPMTWQYALQQDNLWLQAAGH